ncbi:hypothetical protein [Bradyrhizobium sp. RDT46]|uniref:hypothetical protein n=1 Tax=Bradyrhizobium sp. RDT46 TaxID=3341829 RepID=UPI0035C72051
MPERRFYIAFGFDEDGDVDRFYFSERRDPVERWVANGGKLPKSREGKPSSESAAKKIRPRKDVKADSFQKITGTFLDAMNKLHRVIPRTMTMLPLAEQFELNDRFYKPLTKASTRVLKSEGFEIYECAFDQLRLLHRARQDLTALRDGRTSLPDMFLMGLISSYDVFLANLLHLVFLLKPEMLSSSERNISFKDLVELGSIEAARNQIIEKEIETLLRQSHHAQFDSLEARLGIPLRKDLEIWPDFVEICERRNLVTHTGGIVSRQYLSVCKEHNVPLDNLSPGDQLSISPKYLNRSIDIISELGWKLIQVVWRKLKPEEIASAASSLNRESYELLLRRRFKLARTMLKFGLDFKKQGDEETRRMMVVNLAIAERSLENAEEAKRILTREDWSATSNKFKICVSAVQDDINAVLTCLPKISDEEISKDEFREWPAFQWVRVNPAFVAAFEEKFGEAFEPDRGSADDIGTPQLAALSGPNEGEGSQFENTETGKA